MKSKELKTYNLPMDNTLIAQIDAKPTFLFVILICLGILSLTFKMDPIYGAIMISFSLIALIYLHKVVLLEFYTDYLVMYNKADKDNCVVVYYDEIASWHYAWGANRDYLCIELSDGNEEIIEAFSKSLFEGNMNRFLKDKHKKNA